MKVKNKIWRTTKGEDIQVRQMETSHLENCLQLLDRHWPWRRRFHDRFVAELTRRNAT